MSKTPVFLWVPAVTIYCLRCSGGRPVGQGNMHLPRFKVETGLQNLPINIQNLSPELTKQLLFQLYSITGMHFDRGGSGLLQFKEKRLFYYTNKMAERSTSTLRVSKHLVFVKPIVFNHSGTSITARNKFLSTLPSLYQGNILPVYTEGQFDDGYIGSGSRSRANYIILDPSTWQNVKKVNVNRMTWDVGFTFLHELGHTSIGGLLGDNTPTDPIGQNERWLNLVRRQISPSFGARLHYEGFILNGQRLHPI